MSRRYIWVVSFTSGMCVMALEMTASRVVAPHFGTSLSVWANVIGLILVALTAGYWVGGRWAERSPKLQTLLKVLAAAAVLAALIPLLANPVAGAFIANVKGFSGGTLIRLGSFIVIALLFCAPIMLLGMTSPFVIKLLAKEKVGETAGAVFALSTVGSIIGTFGPAFWLVPTIGTRATVLLFAGLLFTVVLAGLGGVRLGLLGVLPLGLAYWVSQQPVKSSRGLVAEAESQYQYIQVIDSPDRQQRMLRFDHGRTVQSRERVAGGLAGGYWDSVLALPNLSTAPKPKVLILGFAGGSAASGIIETREAGAVEVLGVELDDEVVELARQHFRYGRLASRMSVQIDDARTYLLRSSERFDLILLDVYANESYVPPHLVTQEFFRLAKEHLAPGGLLVCNVNAPRKESPLLTSFFKTLESVFSNVESLQTQGSWNKELIASDGPLDWAGAAGRMPPALQGVWANVLQMRTPADSTGGMLLTDDRAPVELLTDAQVFAERKE